MVARRCGDVFPRCAGDGRGYQAMRWTNSKAGAGSCLPPPAGPRAAQPGVALNQITPKAVAGNMDRRHSSGTLDSAEKATCMAGEAIQVLGGNGCINDYPAGRLWHDATLDEIGAGTGAIRRMLIDRELFSETTGKSRIPCRRDDHDRYPAYP